MAKQAFLKHYGKIFLTVLILGIGAYYKTDVSLLLGLIPADDAPVVTQPMSVSPDAGH